MVEVDEVIKHIYEVLDEVMDPEIPVISLTDLGIVRHIDRVEDTVSVTISPTYSGCPATDIIPDLIVNALRKAGFEKIKVSTQLSPAWTTDWISKEGKAKLKAYGIAPPPKMSGPYRDLSCPNCNSTQTAIISFFGSTPCKSLYRCLDCEEPFEAFKCI
jgi:ring-1,2-phenylacetyl-CoA epoxidase subunit PaaD